MAKSAAFDCFVQGFPNLLLEGHLLAEFSCNTPGGKSLVILKILIGWFRGVQSCAKRATFQPGFAPIQSTINVDEFISAGHWPFRNRTPLAYAKNHSVRQSSGSVRTCGTVVECGDLYEMSIGQLGLESWL